MPVHPLEPDRPPPRTPPAAAWSAGALDASDLLLLHRTSSAIVRELEPAAIARAVTEAMEALFSEPRAAAVIVREPHGLRALAHTDYGLDGEPLVDSATDRVTALLRTPGAAGIISWVIEHAQVVRLADARRDPRYLEHDARVRSELCVPVPATGAPPIGAINVESAREDAFSARDEMVLSVVANQLAAALENARLYQAVREELAERRDVERTLRESERRYRTMFETNPHPMWVYDRATLRFLTVNDAAVARYGYSREEFLAMTLRDIRPPEDVAPLERNVASTPAGYDAPDLWRHRLKDGRVIRVEVSSHQVEFGGHDARLVLALDVTEREEAQARQRLHAAVVASTRDAIVVTDLAGRVLSVNRAFTALSGYRESALVGGALTMLRGPADEEGFHDALRDRLAAHGHWQGESWLRCSDGSKLPGWLSMSPVRDEAQQTTHYVGIFTDISKLKESQAETERLASFDPLTGLPNRTLIISRLEDALERAAHHGWCVAVLYVDLDRFKHINDSLGHGAGDEVLCAVARLLQRRLREGDSIGRLGGDEFLVLMESLQGPDEARALAHGLLERLDGVIEIGQARRVHVGASIGISVFPDDTRDAAELVRNADAAMYLAKQHGRQTVRFYSQSLTVAATERLALEMDLRTAIDRQALTLHYQPLFDMSGKRLLGAEALLRWTREDGTSVPPARFVPVAEEAGLIVALGTWVLREACAQLRRWLDAGHAPGLMAVNVSARQLDHGGIEHEVQAALDAHGIDAGMLELEITESAIMRRTRRIETQLLALRTLGVRLAIDDFGTGYSSLAHLKHFPLNTLKIDKSFVMDIPGDGADLQIATAVISMARSLDLEVLAEGVETEEQRRILAERGCDAFQGYLVSPPVPAREFERRFLRRIEATGRA